MRVFDCFTFYNEFDMLELRLEELWDTVDYFVIAEGNCTHQSFPKPFYLKDDWQKVEKYASKIRHVMIEDMPRSSDSWVNERFQRQAIQRGLADLQQDDIVIVSDCDEIARPEVIQAIKEDTNDYDRYILGLPIFYFKLNYIMTAPQTRQRNIAVTRGRAFTNPQREREITFHTDRFPDYYVGETICFLEHGGWHFTYFGDDDFAKNKLLNFAHAESRHVAETVDIKYMIDNKLGFTGFSSPERFEYVIVDDYFPQTIINNLEKYKDKIVPDATCSVYDFYKE